MTGKTRRAQRAPCACESGAPGMSEGAAPSRGTRTDPAVIDDAVGFHGHMCAGLAIGIRAAEVALREIGPNSAAEPVVAVVETDMCAVDAIQHLTGCTFGKGNLIHLDHGKNAYTFIRRQDGRAIRVAGRSGVMDLDAEQLALFRSVIDRTATPAQQASFGELQQQRSQAILEAPEQELFAIEQLDDVELPAPAQFHPSIDCDGCGEPTMQTRLRSLEDGRLCPPCFEAARSGQGDSAPPRTVDQVV